MARRAEASISTRRMRSVERVMHPSTATDPPESTGAGAAGDDRYPVRAGPAQRGLHLCRVRDAHDRQGRPTSTVFERSNRYPSIMSTR